MTLPNNFKDIATHGSGPGGEATQVKKKTKEKITVKNGIPGGEATPVKKKVKEKIYCQEWDSNPCPFGPVPETGALDQLGHLDVCYTNY